MLRVQILLALGNRPGRRTGESDAEISNPSHFSICSGSRYRNAVISNRREAERLLGLIVSKYAPAAKKLAAWLEQNVPQGLTVFDFPAEHRRLRTNNGLERLNREIKRRTRVAEHLSQRSFPAPLGDGGPDGN